MPDNDLEMDPKQPLETGTDKDADDVNLNGYITQQEIEDVVSFHYKLFVSYTKCIWHNCNADGDVPDFTSPLVLRYPVAADILTYYGNILGVLFYQDFIQYSCS